MAVNRFLKRRSPGLHTKLKAAATSWRAAAAPRIPVPMRIAGQFAWVHPRVFTSITTLTQPNVIAWMDEYLRPGDNFLDVGANCGWLSMRAARRVGCSGRVIAFEPSPILADILHYHRRVNGLPQITIVPKAVSNSDSEAAFFLLNRGFSFRNSLTIENDDAPFVRPEDKLRITVPTVTLDRYCADSDLRPTMLKIDVEGAELFVLEGCREILRQARPVIIVGVHPYWLPAGQDAGQIFALLAEYGYAVKDSVTGRVHGYHVGDYLCVA
jgi:FkbM family methyltransferase